ncbi:MAG: M48 family metalloprotease [Treponema sp.]|nr:M48 family metalloprotease [Treponema sp.]
MRKFVFCFFVCCLLTGTVWGQGDLRGAGTAADDAFAAMNRAFTDQSLSGEDEYYLGRAVAANIFAAYRPYNGNPALTGYLNRICQTLVINSSNPVVFNGYFVVIMDSQEYNAFATPGGHIMLTRALVDAAESEDALAALIAHELAHIMLRHAAAIIEHMSLANELDDIAGRAAALAGNSTAAQRALQMRSSVAGVVDAMMKNGYSQVQEFDADSKALELLAGAGYDPRGLLEILQVLQRVQPARAGGFNSTHPSPAQRISNVNTLLQRYRVLDTRAAREPRFRNR